MSTSISISTSTSASASASTSASTSSSTSSSISNSNIGRAAVDREYAGYIYIYIGLAKCSGDGNQKRAPTLMRASTQILRGSCVML